MNSFNIVLKKLPLELQETLMVMPANILENLEEVRLRQGSPISIIARNKEYVLDTQNKLSIDSKYLGNVLNSLVDYSYYAYEEELAKGYITVEGGHRVGICGKAVLDNGNVKLIKDISSLNLRRSKELIGISKKCLDKIIDPQSGFLYNTLIVSPPKCGKTTLLRDIVRHLSTNGLRVGLCDERSEIAGMHQGNATFDVGPRTDILDGCPKSIGIPMLIRSMAPDIIATDEIGKQEDIGAIETALCAGTKLLTTIHGNSFEDILNSNIAKVIKQGAFKRIIYLTNVPCTGTIKGVQHV
ncbi:stage III sporulation protein AA [Clostridium aminobutyricum]|uniref:Stage III sporulation protein AA n=1 Tax=Clostridium aminobutyricum TaxID=33953 RepID=A0A939D6X0_CLOAM|nr:stage III sporulation protein AA [Clostridium aminobutyricum]MBN7772534.1 stage III sporulation protein AA [Clostridium aminobutyricum]